MTVTVTTTSATRRALRRLQVFMSAVATAALLIGMGGRAAGAAVIANAITSVSLETTSTMQQYTVSTFHCSWAVPDNSSAGSTFTLQLPAQLAWFGQASFDLTDSSGDVVATAVADDSGLVTFTLTSFVTSHPKDVSGDCTFTTIFTQTQTQAGPTVLTFEVGSTVFTVPIVETGPCVENCGSPAPTEAYKNMYWANNPQTLLHSYLLTPPTTEATNTIEITDTPAAGSVLTCASVYPTIGAWDTSTGAIAQPDMSAAYPATVACSPAGATVTWTGVPAGVYARVDLDSAVTDTSLSAYQNNGSVTIDGVPAPVQATTERTGANGSGTGSSGSSTPTPTPTVTSTPTVTQVATSVTPAETQVPTSTARGSVEASSSTRRPAQSSVPSPGTLAQTGVTSSILIVVGVFLISVGAGLIIAGRRTSNRGRHR